MSFESPLRDRNDPGYALIETFRHEADGAFVRLERHLARLETSARELGFRFDRSAVEYQLGRLNTKGPLRVRLELSRDGRLDVTTTPFVPMLDDAVWRIAIATSRLDARDPLRRHKTTSREVYAAARSEYSINEIDEVLLLNENGEPAEGTITNLFVDPGDGVLVTPPLSSGALPGVLRAELIETKRAVERVMTLDDLMAARAIFMGNSLRGLIRARLEPVA
ncbi:aminotransferase class IV family protein [Aliihoeflea sp. PC F10.4]